MPHRATRSEWRWLAGGVALLAPVLLLVVVPTALGMDRLVVTGSGSDGETGRGSLVLARPVPVSDLRVGDVIVVRESGSAGTSASQATRRITAIDGGVATTGDDAAGSVERVPLSTSSYSRVLVSVPFVGYPFVLGGGWLLLVLAGLVLLAVLARRGAAYRPTRHALGPARSGSERLRRASTV